MKGWQPQGRRGSVGNKKLGDLWHELTSAIVSQHYLGLFSQAITYEKIHPF